MQGGVRKGCGRTIVVNTKNSSAVKEYKTIQKPCMDKTPASSAHLRCTCTLTYKSLAITNLPIVMKHRVQNPRRVTKHHQSYTYQSYYSRAHIPLYARALALILMFARIAKSRALHVQILCEVLT